MKQTLNLNTSDNNILTKRQVDFFFFLHEATLIYRFMKKNLYLFFFKKRYYYILESDRKKWDNYTLTPIDILILNSLFSYKIVFFRSVKFTCSHGC